jgi:GT2 family glycosyltransferase
MVAIILVNFNGSNDTINCIISLEKQTYTNKRIIVVDNASTDHSWEILKSAQNCHDFYLIKATENKGFSAGCNIGILYALQENAEYILLLNNDTIVKSDCIEYLIKGFAYDTRCGLTIGKIYLQKDKNVIWYAGGSMSLYTAGLKHWEYGKIDNCTDNTIKEVTFATGCCMCISRYVIEKIGLLDESYFLYEEDTEYNFRIMEAGCKMLYVPSAIIYHKVSASTCKSSFVLQYYLIRNKYRIIQQHYQGFRKIIAYSFSTLQMIFRCFKQELKFKCYFTALGAFLRNETGKMNQLYKK